MIRFGVIAALASVLFSPPAQASTFEESVAALEREPAKTPEDAVVAVLQRMRETMRYAPEEPRGRGPHEWTGRQAVEAGTVNGCVESAKAFFALYRAAFPGFKVALIDSFDAVADGGHAVDEVAGADGRTFLVDATSFEALPGAPRLSDAELERPVDIRPGLKGRIYQFPASGDVLVEKLGTGYRLSVHPYRNFGGELLSQKTYPTRAAAEEALAALAGGGRAVDFRWLGDHGLILPYADAERASFLYASGAGGTSRHVIYGRRSEVPDRDELDKTEGAARERYARSAR